jgi:EAL domain-containing protein (putative c-di-GMP-specific phosphodiesterase class I)
VVAEGIETEAEFEAVRELGCEAGQGYYLQAPAPAAEIEEALSLR